MREWQIVWDELESSNVKLLPQTYFLKNRPLYSDVEPWNANVFQDVSSISEIIVEIQVFSDLHQSLNLLIWSQMRNWQIICKPIFNIQETTFFRSFLTAFFEPQTLFGGVTERSPGLFPGRSVVEPEKSVWGSKKTVKNDRKKVVSWIVARRSPT